MPSTHSNKLNLDVLPTQVFSETTYPSGKFLMGAYTFMDGMVLVGADKRLARSWWAPIGLRHGFTFTLLHIPVKQNFTRFTFTTPYKLHPQFTFTNSVKSSLSRTSWTYRRRWWRRSPGRTISSAEETLASAARWRSPEGARSVRTGDPSGGPPSLPAPVVVAWPFGPPSRVVARRSACIWRTYSPASDSNACGPSVPIRGRGCGIGSIWACAGTARSTAGREDVHWRRTTTGQETSAEPRATTAGPTSVAAGGRGGGGGRRSHVSTFDYLHQ